MSPAPDRLGLVELADLARAVGVPASLADALTAPTGRLNTWGPDPHGVLKRCAGMDNAPVVGGLLDERTWLTYADAISWKRGAHEVPVGPALLVGKARLADVHMAGGAAWVAADTTRYALEFVRDHHTGDLPLDVPEGWWEPARVWFDDVGAANRLVDHMRRD